MRLVNCHNFHDFRLLAKQRLPSPIFNYIDGAAEDERTYARNTASFDDCDLVPNVLRGTESVDMQVSIMGKASTCLFIALPPHCSVSFITRASMRSLRQPTNTEPCLAFRHWAPPVFSKSASNTRGLSATNFTFIRTAALIAPCWKTPRRQVSTF